MQSLSINSFLLFLVFSFFSCGNDTSSESNHEDSSDNSEIITSSNSDAKVSSKLNEHQDKPCELLTEEIIKKYVTTDKGITSKSNKKGKVYGVSTPAGCSYSWERLSKEEVGDIALKQMTGGKIDVKTLSEEYNIIIYIKEYDRDSKHFIPKNNLTDEQIEEQAQQASKQAMESETHKDKTAAEKKEYGDIAAESLKKMLIKLRDNTIIVEGVGEAAYFDPVTPFTTLMILSGGKMIDLTVFASEDDNENMEIAKKIAQDIL